MKTITWGVWTVVLVTKCVTWAWCHAASVRYKFLPSFLPLFIHSFIHSFVQNPASESKWVAWLRAMLPWCSLASEVLQVISVPRRSLFDCCFCSSTVLNTEEAMEVSLNTGQLSLGCETTGASFAQHYDPTITNMRTHTLGDKGHTLQHQILVLNNLHFLECTVAYGHSCSCTFSEATHIHNTINHLFVLHIQHVHCSLNVQGERELPKGERNGCITDISPHSSNNLTRQYWETYHIGFSLGLFQRALCPLGPLMCPFGLPKNQ